MNIVFCKPKFSGVNTYYEGLAQTLSFSGYNTFFWSKQSKPTFDMFDEHRPDLLILDDVDYDSSVEKCLNQYPSTKVAVRGDVDKRTDITFGYSFGTKGLYLPKAANVLQYFKQRKNSMFECDYLYMGGHLPLLDRMCASDYSVKLFGDSIRNECSCGYIRGELIGDAFYTAKNVVHLYDYINGDEESQQLYEILYCKGKCLSNKPSEDMMDVEIFRECPGIYFFSGEIPVQEQDFHQDPDILSGNREWIFKFHTYFNRAISLLEALHIESDKVSEAKEAYRKAYYD